MKASHGSYTTDNGYDVLNDDRSFEAGGYYKNDTGDTDDFGRATFYRLEAKQSAYDQ